MNVANLQEDFVARPIAISNYDIEVFAIVQDFNNLATLRIDFTVPSTYVLSQET